MICFAQYRVFNHVVFPYVELDYIDTYRVPHVYTILIFHANPNLVHNVIRASEDVKCKLPDTCVVFPFIQKYAS